MARVSVEFIGAVRRPFDEAQGRPWPEQMRSLELAEGTTITALLAQLGYSAEEARYLSVLVNGTRGRLSKKLGNGDQVVITLVVGGG